MSKMIDITALAPADAATALPSSQFLLNLDGGDGPQRAALPVNASPYRSGCKRLSLRLQFGMENADLVEARNILKGQKWLRGHGTDLIEPLLSQGRLISFETGQWTQAEGDEDTGILVIIRGLVYLLCKAPGDREILIGSRGPGDAIGQTARFGGGPRLLTIQCRENSLVLIASDRVLTQIATKRPQIWQAVAALLYLQLHDVL
jgi:hypothetical protein